MFSIFRGVFWKKSGHFRNFEQSLEIVLSFLEISKSHYLDKIFLIICFTWKQREVSIILRNKKKKCTFSFFFLPSVFFLKKRVAVAKKATLSTISPFFFLRNALLKGIFQKEVFLSHLLMLLFSLRFLFQNQKKIASQKK